MLTIRLSTHRYFLNFQKDLIMKKIQRNILLTLIMLPLYIAADTSLPHIKDNHFRFENFKRNLSFTHEYIYLMCAHKKVTGWSEPKQYIGGEHNLWVKASIENQNDSGSLKETYVNFKVNLIAGKSYMLNRTHNDNKVSLWIQEVNSGIKVSEVVTSQLKRPRYSEQSNSKKRCKLGSV